MFKPIPIRFKPRTRIRKMYKGKYLIVFYPGTEFHGFMLSDGNVECSFGKYPGTYVLKRKDVQILEYYEDLR